MEINTDNLVLFDENDKAVASVGGFVVGDPKEVDGEMVREIALTVPLAIPIHPGSYIKVKNTLTGEEVLACIVMKTHMQFSGEQFLIITSQVPA